MIWEWRAKATKKCDHCSSEWLREIERKRLSGIVATCEFSYGQTPHFSRTFLSIFLWSMHLLLTQLEQNFIKHSHTTHTFSHPANNCKSTNKNKRWRDRYFPYRNSWNTLQSEEDGNNLKSFWFENYSSATRVRDINKQALFAQLLHNASIGIHQKVCQ